MENCGEHRSEGKRPFLDGNKLVWWPYGFFRRTYIKPESLYRFEAKKIGTISVNRHFLFHPMGTVSFGMAWPMDTLELGCWLSLICVIRLRCKQSIIKLVALRWIKWSAWHSPDPIPERRGTHFFWAIAAPSSNAASGTEKAKLPIGLNVSFAKQDFGCSSFVPLLLCCRNGFIEAH